MSDNNFAYAATPTNSIELTYGRIQPEDIPVILHEPQSSVFSRLTSWAGLIIVVLVILTIHVLRKRDEQRLLTTIKTEQLIDLRESKLRKERMYKNELDVPNAKIIRLYIPTNSFGSVAPDVLNCMFSFSATTTKHDLIELSGVWNISGDRYLIDLELPNNCRLTSLIIYAKPTELFAKGWQHTFKSLYIYLYDGTGRITWNDTILLDFKTGNSTAGYISNGYIPIQFDLDKYT